MHYGPEQPRIARPFARSLALLTHSHCSHCFCFLLCSFVGSELLDAGNWADMNHSEVRLEKGKKCVIIIGKFHQTTFYMDFIMIIEVKYIKVMFIEVFFSFPLTYECKKDFTPINN